MSSAYEEDEYDCSDEGDDYEIDPEKLKLIGIIGGSLLVLGLFIALVFLAIKKRGDKQKNMDMVMRRWDSEREDAQLDRMEKAMSRENYDDEEEDRPPPKNKSLFPNDDHSMSNQQQYQNSQPAPPYQSHPPPPSYAPGPVGPPPPLAYAPRPQDPYAGVFGTQGPQVGS